MDRVIRDIGMANAKITFDEAEHMAIATIDWIYRDIEDQSHATCEEIHTVKKCLQVLQLVHELKLEHKM